MAEEGGHSGLATQRGAVHLHHGARNLVTAFLKFKNPPRQLRFASSGRPHEQNRLFGMNCNVLDFLDELVETGVAGLDAGL